VIRKSDLAARYGGEEFAVILSSTDRGGAAHIAEKVRSTVESGQHVFDGAKLKVTVSVGLAVWPDDGRDATVLVAAADRALYAAKQGGRNRVVDAATLPSEPAAVEPA
jgi:diguanylate cyclase (GGDEF)-like protein